MTDHNDLPALLAEWTRVHEAATPQQWLVGGPYPSTSVCYESDPGVSREEPPTWEPIAIVDSRTEGEPCAKSQADARAIAHYHNTYGALLEVVRGLVEWRDAALSAMNFVPYTAGNVTERRRLDTIVSRLDAMLSHLTGAAREADGGGE